MAKGVETWRIRSMELKVSLAGDVREPRLVRPRIRSMELKEIRCARPCTPACWFRIRSMELKVNTPGYGSPNRGFHS